jgi:hypothetical protein
VSLPTADEIMHIDADGPKNGGIIQFENWPYPGVCFRGDRAAGDAAVLTALAMALRLRFPDDRFMLACAQRLDRLAGQLATPFIPG